MRRSTRARPHICLPCQITTGRLSLTSTSPSVAQHLSRSISASSPNFDSHETKIRLIKSSFTETSDRAIKALEKKSQPKDHLRDGLSRDSRGPHDTPVRRVQSRTSSLYNAQPQAHPQSHPGSRHLATSSSTDVELSEAQQEELKVAFNLSRRLTRGIQQTPGAKRDASAVDGMQIEDVLRTLPYENVSPIHKKLIDRIGTEFNGQTLGQVKEVLEGAAVYRSPENTKVTDPEGKKMLLRLGVIKEGSEQDAVGQAATPPRGRSLDINNSESNTSTHSGWRSLADMVAPQQSTTKKSSSKTAQTGTKTQAPFEKIVRDPRTQSVDAKDLVAESLEVEQQAKLPMLSFDLSRVLFNPGIYHLQDPRSRVYNFDPYLEQPMPVNEFNFEALHPYQTSSQDALLLKLAQRVGKRYIGSSSSMTSALSHFHFLISQWRELNLDHLTRGFSENYRSFTILSRIPAAVFLRYRDGVYAVDADKEYDEPNVLMSLGKELEKLLTREKGEFEKWRKSNTTVRKQDLRDETEAFHYSQQGRFLLRSQLDAHDPRLPGTGYFDLKTRAVAGIRMNIREHEAGMGYQIKQRFGTWESYEREYYDMMRSTFLKYSLQARMGDMDGIFVAYHNITRLFGFQYISLSEMDSVLHGQADSCLGDQEFRFSINFMEEIFNEATQAFPGQSLRIHFEAREASVTEPKPYMHIFIEPHTEEEIEAIQNKQIKLLEDFERKLLRGEDPGPIIDPDEAVAETLVEKGNESMPAAEEEVTEESPLPVNTEFSEYVSPISSAANTAFLNQILNTRAARKDPNSRGREIMALKLTLQNKINGRAVTRPEEISSTAQWTIDYQLERLSDEHAKKLYIFCKSRRSSALSAALNRGSDHYFVRSIRAMSEKGAEWRKQQDELDAQRERIVLYGDRISS